MKSKGRSARGAPFKLEDKTAEVKPLFTFREQQTPSINWALPECHVLVDLDRFSRPNWKDSDTKAQRYYRTLMSSNSLGITKRAQPVGGKTGLISFNPPDDEVVFVHELGHLCGMSDLVNSENNLMYQEKKGGKKLGNIPLKAKLNNEDKYGSGMEQQWDCLHDEKMQKDVLTRVIVY